MVSGFGSLRAIPLGSQHVARVGSSYHPSSRLKYIASWLSDISPHRPFLRWQSSVSSGRASLWGRKFVQSLRVNEGRYGGL